MGDMLMVTPELSRFQAPLLVSADFDRLAPGDYSLDMPEPIAMTARNARATAIDETAVVAALEDGVSIRQIMAQFRISHARVKAIQEAYAS
jgi:hypothetical protein